LITSGQYHDPEAGWQVLHFPLSLRAEGVRVENDWNTMGMRGTGSNTVTIENAFVTAEAITLRRSLGKYHGVWDIVFGVAWPLIGAVYLGIAEAAARIAVNTVAGRKDDLTSIVVGEMQNHLAMAQLAHGVWWRWRRTSSSNRRSKTPVRS
jgi:alkylation response protein AidB-like acyl-CoA dehydrogenase